MSYIGKKPVDFNDVTEAQTFGVTGDLTVDTSTLKVDSTNNRVGVGTTAPETSVEIRTTNKLGSTFTGTVDGEGLRVTQTDYTSGNFVSLVEAPFDDAQTAANVRIGAMFDGSGSNLVFGTSNSYGSGITQEAMRIDSSGRVGINDTSPDEGKLVVRGDANANALAVGGNSTTGQSFGTLITAGTNTSDAAFRVFDQSGSSGYLTIRGDGLFSALPIYNSTSSGSANVNVQSSGALLRSTSSEKYKQNIEDMELSNAQAILNLRPVYYKSKCDLDNPDHSHWGFIAEEVDKVDPRLVLYKTVNITYNDEGMPVEEVLETPEPEGVQYDRLTPAIVKLLQEQQKTIKALETKVAALEAK
tara:strand:+ start:915 stop:1988 length:1074 start_codon:yes stop_codon:yes gene_type:complete